MYDLSSRSARRNGPPHPARGATKRRGSAWVPAASKAHHLSHHVRRQKTSTSSCRYLTGSSGPKACLVRNSRVSEIEKIERKSISTVTVHGHKSVSAERGHEIIDRERYSACDRIFLGFSVHFPRFPFGIDQNCTEISKFGAIFAR